MHKKTVIGILCAAVLAAVAGLCLAASRYTLVDFRLYPKNAQSLDLRGEAIHPDVYEQLTEKLPDTQIQFEFAFQGGVLDGSTSEVSVTSLTAEEAEILAALPKLRTVRAESCRDYNALLLLKQLRPDVQVNYHISIGGTAFAASAVQLNLSGIAEDEIPLLQYLPYLKTVTVLGGEPEILSRLRAHCANAGIGFRIRVGGNILSEEATELTLHEADTTDATLLQLASWLKKIHFTEPLADGNALTALAEALPDTAVTWEKTVFGLTFSQDATEIDLTEILALGYGQLPGARTVYQKGLDYAVQHTDEEVRSAVKIFKGFPLPDKSLQTADLIAEAEAAMSYFPEAEKLVMCGCVLDNEAMAAFRQRHREDYKVVWSVDCGEIAPRTDSTFFMPVKYHVYYLNNRQAYNLRYCEEVTALDIGHMNVSDISFVEFMPDLEYLILAHTSVQHIESLATCQKLKFLEVDHTAVQDLTPLLSCTALEDLNIGYTWCPVDPLKEMTWLNNLWMIFRGNRVPELAGVLTETNIVFAGTATVDSGWRDLPNYFSMRDALKMYYMSW